MSPNDDDSQSIPALAAGESAAPLAITHAHRALWAAFFGLTALLLNTIPLEISFAVSLIFGSVVTLMVANICKPLTAVAIAAIASLPTYYHWGHFWSVGIFMAEALFIGLLAQRRPSGVFSSLVIKAGVYWLAIGAPATWLLCWKAIGMPVEASLLVAIKQTLNSVFNAVLAEFCLYLLLPRLRAIPLFSALPKPATWPIRDLTLAFMVGTVLTTGLVMATTDSQLTSEAERARLSQELSMQAAAIENHVLEVEAQAKTTNSDTTDLAVSLMLDALVRDELHPELRFVVYRDGIQLYQRGVPPLRRADSPERTPKVMSSGNNADAMKSWLDSSIVIHETVGAGPMSFTAALPLKAAVDWSLAHDRRAMLDLGLIVLLFALFGIWFSGQVVKPIIKLARLTASTSHEGTTEQIAAIQDIKGFESREGKVLRDALVHALKSKHDALERIQSLAEDRASLIEYAGVPIVVLNLDGTVVDWNQAATNISGLSAKATLGHKIYDVIRDEVDHDKIPLAVGAAASGMVLKDIELHLKSKTGESYTLLVSVVPLHDGDGNANRLLAIGVDISDHLKAEQQLAEMAKMETLGEMATGLSHELNQPLDVVRFVLQNLKRLLKDKEHDPVKVQAKLERIDEQISRAAELVGQMRLLGKAGVSEEKKWFPVDAGIRSAAEMFQEQLALANIDFVTTLMTPAPRIFGNPERLGSVLISLLVNSRDAVRKRFNDDFGGWITIRTRMNGDKLELLVEDNGGGVAEEILSKIFDPFFTSKAPNRGIGLGLAVSYNSIADMGGTITANNTGEGLKVTICLPVSHEHA